jgi:hypothetical protein
VKNPPDERSPIAIASQWVSRIVTVSLEMVVPGLLGLWVDMRLGTKGLFTLIGFIGGSVTAMWHLLRMTGDHRNAARRVSSGNEK